MKRKESGGCGLLGRGRGGDKITKGERRKQVGAKELEGGREGRVSGCRSHVHPRRPNTKAGPVMN